MRRMRSDRGSKVAWVLCFLFWYGRWFWWLAGYEIGNGLELV